MVVYFNVCTSCGNQTEIKEGDNQFKIEFAIEPLSDVVQKTTRFRSNLEDATFCDRDCMVNYFQDFLEINGDLITPKTDDAEEEN